MKGTSTRNVGAIFACIPLLFSGATAKSNAVAERRFHKIYPMITWAFYITVKSNFNSLEVKLLYL